MKLEEEYITRPGRISNGKIVGDRMIRNKLGELEDKQDNGLLFEFPCKPGDILYRIDTEEPKETCEIEPFTVDNIVICKNGDILIKYDAYDGVICHLVNLLTDKPYLDTFRVFLTEEQTKKFLKERK